MAAKMYGEESFSNIPYALKNGSILKMPGLNLGPSPALMIKTKRKGYIRWTRIPAKISSSKTQNRINLLFPGADPDNF